MAFASTKVVFERDQRGAGWFVRDAPATRALCVPQKSKIEQRQKSRGTDFVYDEMMVAPGFGEIARVTTETFATVISLLGTGGLKPGAGPTRDEREKGFYDILFLGELPHGGRVEAVVTGDRDPGYGSTSKMIAESALCLVRDVQGEGGIWTPGALMGLALRKRLTERAGLTFSAR